MGTQEVKGNHQAQANLGHALEKTINKSRKHLFQCDNKGETAETQRNPDKL